MMKKSFSVLLSFLLASSGIVAPRRAVSQESVARTLAILDLQANGVSEVESKTLSSSLRVQITRLVAAQEGPAGYTIIDRSQMDRIFEQFDIQNTGCTDLSCAIEFGKMLDAQRIVIGSVGLVGGIYTISASIVDVETSRTLEVAEFQSRGRIDTLLEEGVSAIANQLFGVQKKSRTKYYIIGGAILIGGIAAALLSGGPWSNTVTVSASITQFSLTVQVTPSGVGSVVPTVGIQQYAEDMVVNLTAIPATVYRLDRRCRRFHERHTSVCRLPVAPRAFRVVGAPVQVSGLCVVRVG